VKSPPGVYDIGQVRWSADDSALQYLVTRKGVTNLWEQPLVGGSRKQLTKFASDLIFSFNWSKDHPVLPLPLYPERSPFVVPNRGNAIVVFRSIAL